MAVAVVSSPQNHVLPVQAWLPLVALPPAVVYFGLQWPAWAFMWVLAFAMYAGFKWLTFADFTAANRASAGRAIAYLCFWPGMDAQAFMGSNQAAPCLTKSEVIWATVKTAIGATLAAIAGSAVGAWPPLAVGWIGMVGLILWLHFGLFHLLSIFWRSRGVAAAPLMDAPVCAQSLSDFWGQRWNRAFRDLSHAYIFRPLHRRLGAPVALMMVFLISGPDSRLGHLSSCSRRLGAADVVFRPARSSLAAGAERTGQALRLASWTPRPSIRRRSSADSFAPVVSCPVCGTSHRADA